MYKYNLVNNDEFKIAYKKYLRKYLLKSILILISIITIIVFLATYLCLKMFYKDNASSLPFVILILITLEVLLIFIAYKKELKKLLNSISNCEINLSFDEKGILILQDDIEKHINWNAVRDVIVQGDNLILSFKITGFTGNFFYFKFFDTPKEVIVSDMKKYTKVKEVK